VYKDGTKVYTKWYSTSNYIDYAITEAGSYKVLAFAKAPSGSLVSKYSSVIVVNAAPSLAVTAAAEVPAIIEPPVDTETDLETTEDINSGIETNTEPDTDSGTETGLDPGTGSETETESDSKTNSGSKPEKIKNK
jgi:hypothetical protein